MVPDMILELAEVSLPFVEVVLYLCSGWVRVAAAVAAFLAAKLTFGELLVWWSRVGGCKGDGGG